MYSSCNVQRSLQETTSNQYTSATHITVLPLSAYQPNHLLGDLMIPNLRVGFLLRCFQQLSIPNIATLRCHWRDSRQTRGQFIPVLSYQGQILSRINACSRQETNLSHAYVHSNIHLNYNSDYSKVRTITLSFSCE